MFSEHSSVISSYLDWWAGAGLSDSVSDEVMDWLAPVAPRSAATTPSVSRETAVINDAGSAIREVGPLKSPVGLGSNTATASGLPSDLADFDAWLATRPTQLGAIWSEAPVLPQGPANAPLMILSDTPDVDDSVAGHLFAGAQGRLLDAMLAAIGLSREMVRIGSIAFTRPPAGRIEGADSVLLLTVARHHIALARPRKLLLLGQQTCSLLTGEVVPPDGLGQRQINLLGGMKTVTAIHHPRLLLKQPLLKRPAWTALKPLKEPKLT
jgi:DNA polymerase